MTYKMIPVTVVCIVVCIIWILVAIILVRSQSSQQSQQSQQAVQILSTLVGDEQNFENGDQTITITSKDGASINGAQSFTLLPRERAKVIWDGTRYHAFKETRP